MLIYIKLDILSIYEVSDRLHFSQMLILQLAPHFFLQIQISLGPLVSICTQKRVKLRSTYNTLTIFNKRNLWKWKLHEAERETCCGEAQKKLIRPKHIVYVYGTFKEYRNIILKMSKNTISCVISCTRLGLPNISWWRAWDSIFS